MTKEVGASANIGNLQTIMKSMPDEQKGEFASTLVHNLGRDTTPGAEHNFNLGRFYQNYTNMADKAKDAVFGPLGSTQRDSLESAAKTAQRLVNVTAEEGSWSKPESTAYHKLVAAGTTAFGAHQLMGVPGVIGAAAAAAITNGGAHLLMNPNFTKMLDAIPQLPPDRAIKLLNAFQNLPEAKKSVDSTQVPPTPPARKPLVIDIP